MKKTFILFFLILIIYSVYSKPKSFWRYGDNYSYSITLDNKWETDLDYANQMGFNNFFYYKESKESKYPESLIMVNLFNQGGDVNTLEEFINFNIDKFNKVYPEFYFKKLDWKIKTKKKIEYQIYYIYSNSKTVKQYVLYLKGEHPYFLSIALQLDVYGINNNNKYIKDFKNIIKSIQLISFLKLDKK